MKKLIKISLVALFWIVVWYLAVLIYSSINGMNLWYNPLFPYPHDVFKSMLELFGKGDYYIATLATMLRTLVSIIIAILLGFGSAVLCSRLDFIHTLLKPLLATIKSVPVTVFVFLIYGLTPICQLNTTPYSDSDKLSFIFIFSIQ